MSLKYLNVCICITHYWYHWRKARSNSSERSINNWLKLINDMGAEILNWKDKRKEDAFILNFTSQSPRNVYSRHQMLVNSLLVSLNKRVLKKLILQRSGGNTSSSQCKKKDTVFQFKIFYFGLTGKARHRLQLHVIYIFPLFLFFFSFNSHNIWEKQIETQNINNKKIKRNKLLLQRIFIIQIALLFPVGSFNFKVLRQ